MNHERHNDARRKERGGKTAAMSFCGVKPQIIICDDEGNIKRDDDAEEYIEEQWSGLSFALVHPIDGGRHCPVATDEDDDIVLGNRLHSSPD